MHRITHSQQRLASAKIDAVRSRASLGRRRGERGTAAPASPPRARAPSVPGSAASDSEAGAVMPQWMPRVARRVRARAARAATQRRYGDGAPAERAAVSAAKHSGARPMPWPACQLQRRASAGIGAARLRASLRRRARAPCLPRSAASDSKTGAVMPRRMPRVVRRVCARTARTATRRRCEDGTPAERAAASASAATRGGATPMRHPAHLTLRTASARIGAALSRASQVRCRGERGAVAHASPR